MSYRDLAPVEHNVERPEALSQTFLNRVDVCARSGYLYQLTKGGPTSHPMDRGTAGHLFAERFIQLIVDQNENTAPPEVAKTVLEEVLAEHPEWQLPAHELDALGIIAHHFAESLWVDPGKVVALEHMLELEIAGVRVRGKVDYVELHPESRHAHIRDWKMSFAPKTSEDEGGDFDKLFQTLFYGLCLLEGKGSDDPVPIGKGLETVTVEEVYCRNKGLPAPRKATLSRQQLLDFKHKLEVVIARADLGFTEGKWNAVPGSHCSKCPAREACPLPPELIPAAMPDDDIEAMAERWYWLSTEATRVKKKLRAVAEEHGPIPIGSDLELAFSFSAESKSVEDVSVVEALIEESGRDPSDYIKRKPPSARFDKRKVKAA